MSIRTALDAVWKSLFTTVLLFSGFWLILNKLNCFVGGITEFVLELGNAYYGTSSLSAVLAEYSIEYVDIIEMRLFYGSICFTSWLVQSRGVFGTPRPVIQGVLAVESLLFHLYSRFLARAGANDN